MLGWWLPENISTYNGEVFHFVYWSCGIGMLIAQALLSRVRHGASTHDQAPTHDRAPLEMVWAVVPALIVICLGLLSHRSGNEIAPARPQIALEETHPGQGMFTAASLAADGSGR